jgi:ribonuclease HI
MPWLEATLRGKRVFARANSDRSLLTASGRVEIRYRVNDGRAYHASIRNIEVAPDARLLGDEAFSTAQAASSAARSGDGTGDHATAKAAWNAFTDGACSGNPGPAGAGVVLVSPDGKTSEGLEYLGDATNNVAELTAILRALEWIPSAAREIFIHTDSQYAIGVLQKGWKAKANQELVLRTRQRVETRRARLVYVPGHQGVPLNERADALAREAIETRLTRAARP